MYERLRGFLQLSLNGLCYLYFWGERHLPGAFSQPGSLSMSCKEAGAQRQATARPSPGEARCGRGPPLPCRPVNPAAAGCAAGWPWAGAGARRRPPPPLLPLRSSACPRTRIWRACRCSGPRSGLSETRPTFAHWNPALTVQCQFTETEPSGVNWKSTAGIETESRSQGQAPSNPGGSFHSLQQPSSLACQLGRGKGH